MHLGIRGIASGRNFYQVAGDYALRVRAMTGIMRLVFSW